MCLGNDTLQCQLQDVFADEALAKNYLESRIEANLVDNCGNEDDAGEGKGNEHDADEGKVHEQGNEGNAGDEECNEDDEEGNEDGVDEGEANAATKGNSNQSARKPSGWH